MIIIQLLALLIYSINVSQCNQLVGYDCSHNDLNYTLINLNTALECSDDTADPITTTEYIQLVEIVNDAELDYINCHVIITRNIFYCGMHSHLSATKGGYMSYPLRIGRDRCNRAIQTGELCLFCDTPYRVSLTNLEINKSYKRAHTFAGIIEANSGCKGVPYSDEFGSWNNVIVEGYITVIISKGKCTLSKDDNNIHLPHSISCPAAMGFCDDDIYGEFFWKVFDEDSCYSSYHKVLYEGPSNITSQPNGKRDGYQLGIVTVITQNILFSLQVTAPRSLCSLEAYSTEHPKLIIIKRTGFDFIFKKSNIKASELDLFTYMNSKFVFIERNLQLNMNALYKNWRNEKCQSDLIDLQIKLAIGMSNPQEFGYMFGGGPGFMATRVGEVIYLSKCKPVYVTLRKTEKCYNELPIMYKNHSHFLAPKTKLIQSHGSEVMCNSIFPPVFEIAGAWYRIMNGIYEIIPPKSLTVDNTNNWEYKSISNLASSGIYTQDDLNDLRDHIMHGSETAAVTTILTRSVQGMNPDYQGVDGMRLLTDDGLEKISNKISEKFWAFLTSFGNISSGVLGLFFIFKIIKWFINTMINSYLLYQIYGASIKVLAGLMDALTMLFVHKAEKKDHNGSKFEEPMIKYSNETCVLPISDDKGNAQNDVSQQLLTPSEIPSAPTYNYMTKNDIYPQL